MNIRPIKQLFTFVSAACCMVISSTSMAGSYIAAGETFGVDIITHPTGYTGSGGQLNISVGIDPSGENATEMVGSVVNLISTFNQLQSTSNNLLLDANNIIPSDFIDFQSVALHEMGHCIGLGHVNLANEPNISNNDRNYTKSTDGSDNSFNLNDGADNVKGSKDDSRGDDQNLHWFRKLNNNPFTIASRIDSSTYSRQLSDLPSGHTFAANGDRDVGTLLGVANTESIMQQGTLIDEVQHTMIHDDVATLKYAMSGLDEIAGTNDDYTFTLTFAGLTTNADIVLKMDSSKTGFASCQTGLDTLNAKHVSVSNPKLFFNPDFNWFFTPSNNTAGKVTINDNTPIVGQKLSANVSDPDGISTSINYQWKANNKSINGATGRTYTVRQSDTGKELNVTASFTDNLGNPETVSSSKTNAVDGDNDGDGLGDSIDPDDDNDGTPDDQDAFPFDPSETSDFDSDGIGDNADPDDDNDGVDDVDDAFPFDSKESADSDNDGIGDNQDPTPYPPTGILDIEKVLYSVGEDNGSIEIAVVRTGGEFGDISVDYSLQDLTARASSDYIFKTGTLSFPQGVTRKTFNLSIIDDVIFETYETFLVELLNFKSDANGNGQLGEEPYSVVKILDNDSAPPAGKIGFQVTNTQVNENSNSVNLNVLRTESSEGSVSFSFHTEDLSATSPEDYISQSNTLTFKEGETAKNITITIKNDNQFENNESFRVNLTNLIGDAAFIDTTATVLIIDDDPQPPSGVVAFEKTSADVSENAGKINIDLIRTGGSAGEVKVKIVSSNGSATSGEDFKHVNRSITMADGQTQLSFNVTLIDDTDYEDKESFSLNLTSVNGTQLGNNKLMVVNIIENEQPPAAGVLELSSTGYSTSENNTAINVTIVRSGGSDGDVSVIATTSNGSAKVNQDYIYLNKTLFLLDGEISQTFSIVLLDDSIYEGDEHFDITLSSPTGNAVIGSNSSADILIKENDPTPPSGVIQLAGSEYTINESTNRLTIDVVRVNGDYGYASVNISAKSGTANKDQDFTFIDSVLSFADGENSQSITIDIIEDTIDEDTEFFELILTNPINAVLGNINTATVNIEDNDESSQPSGTLQLSASSFTVAESSGDIVIEVIRTDGSFGQISVDVRVNDISASNGSDFNFSNTTLVFAEGVTSRQIKVEIIDDTIDENTESFEILLTDANNAALGNIASSIISIEDNDEPALSSGTLQLSAQRLSASESSGNIVIDILRTNGSFGQVSVDVTVKDITATNGVDYNLENTTLVFADGVTRQQISIEIIEDLLVEELESFEIILSNNQHASLGNFSIITVVIEDNDSTTESQTLPPPSKSKGGGSSQVVWLLMLLLLFTGRRFSPKPPKLTHLAVLTNRLTE